MKRHYVAALFLAAALAVPAVAAEKSRPAEGVGNTAAVGAGKDSRKVAAKKKPVAEKPVKIAHADKPSAATKSPMKTTRRMRGYGN
jgi:hypothetical protein